MAANNSTNNILKQILIELDTIKNAQKVAAGTEKGAVPKSNIGNINIQNAKTLNDSLSGIAGSMTLLKKISKRDVDNVANMIDVISQTFSKITIKKENVSGLNDAMSAFAKMHDMISNVSKSFIQLTFKYNPLKGRIAGWSLGGFYQNFMKGFETRLQLKDFTDKFKGENIGANLTGLSNLMQALLSFDYKKLLKIGMAWKAFPVGAGKNIAAFMDPIIKTINKMPAALSNEKKSVGMFGTGTSEKIYVTNPQISGFLEVFAALTSITARQIRNLSYMGKKLNGDKGKNIGRFFSSFVKEVTKYGIEKTRQASKVVNSITAMLLSLTVSLVLITATVALAGWDKTLMAFGILSVLVTGSMFIIKKLGDKKIQKNAKESLFTTLSLTILYTSLTLNLAIITSILKNNKWEHVVGGLIILSALTLSSLWLVKQLGDKKMQSASKNSLLTVNAIALLFLSMSAMALLSVQIGKYAIPAAIGVLLVAGLAFAGVSLINHLSKMKKAEMKNGLIGALAISAFFLIMTASIRELLVPAMADIDKIGWKGILVGLGVLALMTVGGMLMVKNLSKMKKAEMKNGLIGALAISALFLIMSFSLKKYMVPAMADIDKIGWKGILTGIGIMVVMAAGGMLMVKILSKANKNKLKKGILAAEGIAVVILTLSKGLQLFGRFLESIHKVTASDIAIGSAITLGMITLVGAACYAASTFVMGPQAVAYAAGIVALEGIALVITTLSGALLLFAKMIEKVNKTLTVKSIDSAKNMIVGNGETRGLVGCILDIVEGLDKIGIKTSLKIAVISKNLNPLFFGISTFCDVIQKMSTMKMLDYYDDKGKPHYKPLKAEDFTNAAVNLSVSFSTFLKELNSAFINGPTALKMYAVIKGLTKGGVTELMKSLGLFADSIIKLASLQVPDKWDKDGKPISYKTLKKSDFKQAAINLASAFSTFLLILKDELASQSTIIGRAVKSLTGKNGGIKSLMDAVCSAVEPFVKMAQGTMKIGGNVYKTDLTTLTKGAEALVRPMAYILKEMTNLYKDIDDDDIEYVCDCIKMVNKTMSKSKNFHKNANELVKGSDVLFKWINTTVMDANKMKIYASNMETLGRSLSKHRLTFMNASKSIHALSHAIKKLDAALITNSSKRVSAINMVTTSIEHLNDKIGNLNKELAQSVQIANMFNQLKDANDKNFIINAVSYVGKVTKEVGDKVEKIHTSNEKAAVAKTSAVNKQQQEQPNNNEAIVMAIIEGLNQWNTQHKDITIEINGNPLTIGTIYGHM